MAVSAQRAEEILGYEHAKDDIEMARGRQMSEDSTPCMFKVDGPFKPEVSDSLPFQILCFWQAAAADQLVSPTLVEIQRSE